MEATLLAALQALLAAGAGLYLWVFVSQLTTPGFGRLQKWLRASWRRPLTGCPWCSGFWVSAILVIAQQALTGALSPITTPLAILASAAIVGYVGSMTPGVNDEGE